MKNTKFNRNDILAIVKKHKLGKITKISYSKSGMVNPCLFLNDKYVLRINVRDPEIAKFKREEIAFNKLKKEGFCPKKVFLNADKKIIPYTYIITEKLKGKEIEKDWSKFSKKKKKDFSFQAGRNLAIIHKAKMPWFGDLVKGGEKGNFKTWQGFILDYLKTKISQSKRLKVLNKKQGKRILDEYKKFKPVLSKVKTPSLLHDDYHLDNMVYYKNKITGIFDFEWARAGDPEFDLKKLEKLDNEDFYKGYTSIRKLSNDFDKKIVFYKLISSVGLLPVAKRHWSEKSVRNLKKEIKFYLERLK